MADNVFGGPLNAGRVLRASSSQEALNLDEQVQSAEPAQISRNVLAFGLDQKNHFHHWWQRHVCLSTSHDDCRDHFGKRPISSNLPTLLTKEHSKRKDSSGIHENCSGLGDAWCRDSPAHALAAIVQPRSTSRLLRHQYPSLLCVSPDGITHLDPGLLSLL